jgi:hypothetical protein
MAAPAGALDTIRGRIEDNWDFGPPFVTNQHGAYAVREVCKRS